MGAIKHQVTTSWRNQLPAHPRWHNRVDTNRLLVIRPIQMYAHPQLAGAPARDCTMKYTARMGVVQKLSTHQHQRGIKQLAHLRQKSLLFLTMLLATKAGQNFFSAQSLVQSIRMRFSRDLRTVMDTRFRFFTGWWRNNSAAAGFSGIGMSFQRNWTTKKNYYSTGFRDIGYRL
jgi:hypothetical protein